ncbi:MAG: ATP-dependent helicase [Candidatus Aenigmatarchaeota archaeon]
MIGFVNTKKLPKDEKVLALLRPYVREWFKRNFKQLTLPQKFSIPLIKKGENVLITAPTGIGKTLSSFLAIIDELFILGEKKELEDVIYCVYISPLKALDNDIYKNLIIPLKEIKEIAKEMGIELPEVRIAVRTGDVSPHEKQKQLRLPPHILVTTPETIAIVLSTRKFKEKFKKVRWVIVDEIHELANSKRGVHLSLSLERLQNFVGKPFVRIGMGATLEPLKEVAKFLVGYENGKERDCKIIDARFVKPLDIKLLSPVKDLVYTQAETITNSMYKLLDKLIQQHRTTLVFTNTRSGTERCVHHLKQMFPEVYTDEQIGAHHSSVSREIRLEIEDKLKNGKLKVVVSSTSLELGIDIGYIDLVCQLGSPKSITRCIQRIGRAGHRLHEVSKGRIICMDRDDLVECAVMIQQAYRYFLDKIQIPENCLDVLAQHLMGMSLEKKWNVKEAFNLIRNSYCYRNLKWEDFVSVLEFLSGAYHTLEDKKVYAKIWFDPKDMMFGRRGKYARVIYSLNIGTIPDEVKIKVRSLDGRYIGSIEEEFLQRLLPGDIFVLAGKTYEFIKARQVTAFVKPVKEKRPTVPAWFSEMLPLSFELALKIQEFRGKMFKLVKNKSKKEVIKWLLKNYYLDEWSANSIYEYFLWEYKFLKSLGAKNLPDEKTILIENYIDEKGNQNIIFHTLFGRRINDALSRAFGYLLTKKIKKSVGLTVSDNGFVISIPSESIGSEWLDLITLKAKIKRREEERIDPKELVKLLKSSELEEVLRKALRQTELIKRRFRHCATRSLMILRNYKGYEIKVARQQMNADRLLRVCEKFENFPVVEETYREVMQDFMDLEHAKWVLEQVEKGRMKYEFLPESNVPSPFSHSLIALGESDVVLMEDRKKLLLELHKKVMERVGETGGEK